MLFFVLFHLQVQGFPEFRHQRVFLRDVLHPVLESDRARGPYMFIDRDLQLDPSRHSGQLGDPHEHPGLAAQDFVAQLRRRDAHRDRVAAEEHLLEGRDEARPPFADQRQDAFPRPFQLRRALRIDRCGGRFGGLRLLGLRRRIAGRGQQVRERRSGDQRPPGRPCGPCRGLRDRLRSCRGAGVRRRNLRADRCGRAGACRRGRSGCRRGSCRGRNGETMTETSAGKIKKEEHIFKSTSGVCDIHTVIWYPDKEKYENPLGVVQIAHGMIDHIERFEGLALYLTERGFVVAGNDHLGHGDSVNDKNDWGYFAKGNNSGLYLVKDMHKLTIIMKKRFPELPYILIGHSMGSFMTRRYLMMYGNELDAAVILGTGNQPKIMVDGGLLAVKFTKLFHGDHYRSETLNRMMFGTYNNRIENPVTDSDWITRNPDIVNDYVNDEKCSFLFTVNAYEGMLKIIRYVINDANIEKTPKELPLLIASGNADPVGEYGKAVERIYNKYKKHMDDVELKLYDGCRHELHSEINAQEVFEDIYNWIVERVG